MDEIIIIENNKKNKLPKNIIISIIIYKLFGLINNELYLKNKDIIEDFLNKKL